MSRDHTPPVGSRYGAPMGRRSDGSLDPEAGRFRLVRIRLNLGGYDAGGAYWGLGVPLWRAEDGDGRGLWFRARDRAAAKETLRRDYPEAQFYDERSKS